MKFILKFDKFFKKSAGFFFPLAGFKVQTEYELFKLPKKLDVLLIEDTENNLAKLYKEKFYYFYYFKKYNLVSFKSPAEITRSKDFTDSIVYYNGFLGMEKNANHKNTTMTLIVNNKPVKFLKENKSFITEVQKGHYIANYNLFELHIIDLTHLEFKSIDGIFLLLFSIQNSLEENEELFEEFFKNYPKEYKKIVDEFKKILYTRVRSFETEISFFDKRKLRSFN